MIISAAELNKYFGKDTTPREMKDQIIAKDLREYSQTKSNTQRPLMYPDEVMRMDNRECLVLLRDQKPLRLYKIIPDEHPSFGWLRDVRVSDYVPHWRQEEEKPKAKPAPPSETPDGQPAAPVEQESVPLAPPSSPPPPTQKAGPASPPPDAAPPKAPGGWGPQYDYGLLDPVDGFGDVEQEPDSGQDAPYGGFELIETEPQNVGGEQQEGQR